MARRDNYSGLDRVFACCLTEPADTEAEAMAGRELMLHNKVQDTYHTRGL
jgi:hypothetical protein